MPEIDPGYDCDECQDEGGFEGRNICGYNCDSCGGCFEIRPCLACNDPEDHFEPPLEMN